MSEPDATRPDQPTNQPPAGQQPPAGYQPPPAGYQQPPAGYQQPPAGYQPPPVGYQQAPPVGYQQAPAIPQSPQPTPLTAGADYTGAFSQAEVNEAKVISLVGYLGILFLLPMLVYPKNGFARFHANQSLVLLIGSVVLWIAVNILAAIIHPLAFLGVFTWLIPMVFVILGMINAGQGQAKALPLFGNIQILK